MWLASVIAVEQLTRVGVQESEPQSHRGDLLGGTQVLDVAIEGLVASPSVSVAGVADVPAP